MNRTSAEEMLYKIGQIVTNLEERVSVLDKRLRIIEHSIMKPSDQAPSTTESTNSVPSFRTKK